MERLTIDTKPIAGQKPGTSGLRKKTRTFMQSHYLENFVQAIWIGIGGVAAVIFGSIILMDTGVPGFAIPTGLLVGVGASAALLFGGVMYLVMRSQPRRHVAGVESLVGRHAEVIDDFRSGRGRVHVEGEDWHARSKDEPGIGDTVRIRAVDGLVLEVEAIGEKQ